MSMAEYNNINMNTLGTREREGNPSATKPNTGKAENILFEVSLAFI